MSVEYDKYYKTENLFGDPYPELIDFYSKIPQKGKLLDLGCGQGRDSVPLAKLGFEVVGIDNSKVGIDQLNKTAQIEKLNLIGIVDDIYTFSRFDEFDFILLDSMFHFGKKEKQKESNFLRRIIENTKQNAFITICIQNTGNKFEILVSIMKNRTDLIKIAETEFAYKFEDKKSNHSSKTNYKMITIKKN